MKSTHFKYKLNITGWKHFPKTVQESRITPVGLISLNNPLFLCILETNLLLITDQDYSMFFDTLGTNSKQNSNYGVPRWVSVAAVRCAVSMGQTPKTMTAVKRPREQNLADSEIQSMPVVFTIPQLEGDSTEFFTYCIGSNESWRITKYLRVSLSFP